MPFDHLLYHAGREAVESTCDPQRQPGEPVPAPACSAGETSLLLQGSADVSESCLGCFGEPLAPPPPPPPPPPRFSGGYAGYGNTGFIPTPTPAPTPGGGGQYYPPYYSPPPMAPMEDTQTAAPPLVAVEGGTLSLSVAGGTLSLSPKVTFLLFFSCVFNTGWCIWACINRKKNELGEDAHVRTVAWVACLLTSLLGCWCCCWIPFVVSLYYRWLHVFLVSTALAAH